METCKKYYILLPKLNYMYLIHVHRYQLHLEIPYSQTCSQRSNKVQGKSTLEQVAIKGDRNLYEFFTHQMVTYRSVLTSLSVKINSLLRQTDWSINVIDMNIEPLPCVINMKLVISLGWTDLF